MGVHVTKSIELDYGHTLPNHMGFCNQFHGHRARIEATVEGPIVSAVGSSQGMVYDFKDLKAVMMREIHDVLDHGFAVWKASKEDREFIQKRNTKVLVTEEPPTAEYLAIWAFQRIAEHLPDGLRLVQVVWYETPTSKAIYSEPQPL